MPPDQTAIMPSTLETLHKARALIPPLLSHFHKGQLGRIAVVGGSASYTGAPYFSATASALLGADLSHVICEPRAAAVIKTYNPNLMVHPLLHEADTPTPAAPPELLSSLLSRLHAVVIGPGLGRDPNMQNSAKEVMRQLRERKIPFVVDADALLLVVDDPACVRGYKSCVLTPNVVEFARLCKGAGVGEQEGGEGCRVLARELGCTVLRKGEVDWISDGEVVRGVEVQGGRKRSGGQGDTLTGVLATLLAWRQAYLDRLWEHEGGLEEGELLGLAVFAASAITRTCSRRAFERKGRAMQASDLSEEVPAAFMELFGGEGGVEV